MKILLINGSVRGKNSSSYKVASAFLKGMKEALPEAEAEEIHLSKINMKPCIGCLSCWKYDSGKCVINDDLNSVKEKLVEADTVICDFPLYYFGVSGLFASFLDRMVCLAKAYRGVGGNDVTHSFLHEWRYEKLNTQKRVFVSTCGYELAGENYDAVKKRFDFMFGEEGHTDIFVGQGGAIAEKTLAAYVEKFLLRFEEAGKEFALNGALSEETKDSLKKPLLRHNTFVRAINMSWDTEAGPYGKKIDN